MSPALILLVGVMCSGKTTYAKRFKPSEVVSIDECSERFDGQSWWDAEKLLYSLIETRSALGLTSCADATNLVPLERHRLREIGRQFRLPVRCVFMDTPAAVIRARNDKLFRPFTSDVMDACLRKAQIARRVLPTEGYDEVEFV